MMRTTDVRHLESRQQSAPLWDPAYERDSCGVGLVVDIAGKPSREIVEKAIAGLVNLTHRGGVGADERAGDGAGILLQLPHAFLSSELGRDLTAGDYGVAMVFLPIDEAGGAVGRRLVEQGFAERGLAVDTWRVVPVNADVLGPTAVATQPSIAQAIVLRPDSLETEAFERAMMLARRAIERLAANEGLADKDLFVASCSCRTIVYKGFFLPEDLDSFYPDLKNPLFESAIALFHQRYSTNTFPTWGLAQPFRFLAHNGEINTVQGNRTWMQARSPMLELADGTTADELRPVVSMSGSDSLTLDNAIELIRHSDRSLPHALMMAVPEPWEQLPEMNPERRAFYDFHAGLLEQWDGPAALGFSDGVIAGATLDRNGLRPLRWAITEDGWFVAGSEAGTVNIDQTKIVEKGRLGPGQMIAVDTSRGVVLRNEELKQEVAHRQPYADWLDEGRIKLNIQPEPDEPSIVPVDADAKTRAALTKPDPLVVARQRAFGYTAEDIRLIVMPMGGERKEPTWSMGDDAPLAVLSDVPRPLTAYFRQRFAQVTNPAIDSLRERSVMALDAFIGPRSNPLVESKDQAKLIHLRSMVLAVNELEALRSQTAIPVSEISTVFSLADDSLKAAIDRVCAESEAAVRAGSGLLIISDTRLDESHAAVPMSLAVGAAHNHLIRQGLRTRADIVCETGEVWDVHQFAILVGYGASGVHPYLALGAAAALAGTRGYEETRPLELRRNYIYSLEYGFLKVTAKMGISTASGYRGAQIFEAIGLSPDLVDAYFTGTPSRLGGIGLTEIEADVRARHEAAFTEMSPRLPDHGLVKFKKDGEAHAYSPTLVKAIQKASQENDKEAYEEYRELVRQQPLTTIRDLLELKPIGPAISVDEVEPAEAIIKRFIVTAMSLGSLSPEAHQTLAIAMNRLGARSNSGEGGEDPSWYDQEGPDVRHNKVKQVASGRFGVTARYLSKAEELEIKVAQGAKPGEGGQLPGFKVTEFVARMRHAVPGLPLISPPPHHDIYSIEDLAQLIYDLRQINPKAKIGVKLVAEAGVGTVAAGVAKARADYILIAGHSGGTGAAPLASIKHAGVPWELGLAETQQTLIMNGLRSRVRLRTDGGLKTPEDVLVAAMLGADEFGFGTSVLVAMGCDMARQCHLNTCPTGIATQRADLRAKFTGTPEMIIGYFNQLVQAVRETMAALGARSIEELIGRTDLLGTKQVTGRASLLDLSSLLPEPAAELERRKSIDIDHDAEDTLDKRMLAQIEEAISAGRGIEISEQISTKDRTVGARIAGRLTVLRETQPSPMDPVTVKLKGSAGQSFGAFLVNGLNLELEGEANDYVGKGMTGGEITIRPIADAAFTTPQAIAGNTLLYGATGGSAFIAGRVGERFMVRNSGCSAVVEGVGDHGCEYMTGGVAVILGRTGRNFGAGMTNGRAFVYDPQDGLSIRINTDSVDLERVQIQDQEAETLRGLIERHLAATGSAVAKDILDRWNDAIGQFWHVIPNAVREAAALASVTEQELAEGAAD
jgi:glutamate synthase domain-containing protein 2/glutamate synthase domain-containing protein 1/glutamate synthase domain-containing protein 3